MTEWAVGQVVAWSRHRFALGKPWSVATVERLTKTQVVTDDGSRWRRSDGRRVGSRSGRASRDWLVPYGAQERRENARGAAAEALRWRMDEMGRALSARVDMVAAARSQAAMLREAVDAYLTATEDQP